MAVTASDLKERFEAFDGLSDARVELALVDARRQVDDSWLEDDRDRATILLACHYLILEDALGGGSSTIQTRTVQSEKLGDAQVNYYIPTGGEANNQVEGLEGTAYGKRYLSLLRQNQAGPMII